MRRAERSRSPQRDTFARSPLNETSYLGNSNNRAVGLRKSSDNLSSPGLPQRPPSVSLPSIGQEGSEYASFYEGPSPSPGTPSTPSMSPAETRNIDSDLKLHAPKPALPTSSARAKIATVTRTDSSQAAAIGIGKASTDDKDPHTRSLKSRSSFPSRGSSVSTERPSSTQGDNEQGIPEIGLRVPMYPNAGDVQAPSPAPFSQTPSGSGLGFHHEGQHKQGRHHGRTRSGREHFHPPGSYGLHGHGTPSNDKFERDWYEKHPEALEREEHGEYGPGIGGGRGAFALSSDDLNKLVRDTASRGAGFGKLRLVKSRRLAKFNEGTTPAAVGTPDEQIGYRASEEYATRLASSRPPSTSYHHKTHSNPSQTHVESPLRKTSFPANAIEIDAFKESKRDRKGEFSESALESEVEDDIIHVDPPSYRATKIGGGGYDPPTEDLGPHGGNTVEEGGWIEERGYGAPILASDELAKGPGAEFMQPAISPRQERRGSDYHAGFDSDHPPSYMSGLMPSGSRGSSIAGSRPTSRPTSRPGSIHGGVSGLVRFSSLEEREETGTPLEDVEEYEPLFPDDEKNNVKKIDEKRLTKADKLRLFKHKFPSKDIWEDAPSSAQLMATVSTPELPSESVETAEEAERNQEAPAADAVRRQNDIGDIETTRFLPRETKEFAKPHFKPGVLEEIPTRPGMKQRFPSRDIWEDTPASLQLQTTVTAPQVDDIRSPPDVPERPTTGAVAVVHDKAATGTGLGKEEGRATTSIAATLEKPEQPSIPTRPARSKGGDKPAESVAAQPARKVQQASIAETPISPSKSSSAPARKPSKPSPLSTSPTKTDDQNAEARTSPVTERKAPTIPGRPKPQVPTRPTKPAARESTEDIPLAKTTSATSTRSIGSGSEDAVSPKDVQLPPAPKPKPAVPARPGGSKIASLKAGFLSDLDKRLQLGPQGVKPPEKKEEPGQEEPIEKLPLSDARKGRARGPARRKPAVSPTGTDAVVSETAPAQLGIFGASTVWSIAVDGALNVPSHAREKVGLPKPATKAAHTATPTLARNTAGEPIHEPNEVAPGSNAAAHPPDPIADDNRRREEAAQKLDLASRVTNQSEAIDAVVKPSDDPPISGQVDDPTLTQAAEDEEDVDPAFVAAKLANTASTQLSTSRAEGIGEEIAGLEGHSLGAKEGSRPETEEQAETASKVDVEGSLEADIRSGESSKETE
ncbi:MAG: hypothetical protein M1833_004905 [Piccolia ochrophora]|nr:MAG: hypothetical protein M1833_004905 [Piccolia ochrophora]